MIIFNKIKNYVWIKTKNIKLDMNSLRYMHNPSISLLAKNQLRIRLLIIRLMNVHIIKGLCSYIHAYISNLSRHAQLIIHLQVDNSHITFTLLESSLRLCIESLAWSELLKHIIASRSTSLKFVYPHSIYLVLIYFFVYHNQILYLAR